MCRADGTYRRRGRVGRASGEASRSNGCPVGGFGRVSSSPGQRSPEADQAVSSAAASVSASSRARVSAPWASETRVW